MINRTFVIKSSSLRTTYHDDEDDMHMRIAINIRRQPDYSEVARVLILDNAYFFTDVAESISLTRVMN